MTHPLAWYITWTTYGAWLQGDTRGSFLDRTYLRPDEALELAMKTELADAPVFLTESQRDTVDRALVCACAEQPWTLHERNVRTNHVHVVVSADRDGRFVRAHLKAIASAALSDAAGLPMADKNGRRRWWTEKGNVEAVESERALTEICLYVRERQ